MLNPDRTPRTYKHIDPEALPESKGPPHPGTNAECLADGLLDILQIALETGLTQDEVDEAMQIVQNTLAAQERYRFRLHVRPSEPTGATATGPVNTSSARRIEEQKPDSDDRVVGGTGLDRASWSERA